LALGDLLIMWRASSNPTWRGTIDKAIESIDPKLYREFQAAETTPAIRERAERERAERERAELQRQLNQSMAKFMMQLKSPRAVTRREAANGLGDLGPDARSAVPELLAALKDSDGQVRINVVLALGEVGATPQQVVRPMLEALYNDPDAVRSLVLPPLRQLGDGAIPILDEAARDRNPKVAAFAAELSARLREEAELRQEEVKKVRPLVARLTSPQATERRDAAVAIGTLGLSARSAVPDLLAVLRDADPDVRKSAAVTLAGVGATPQEVVGPLLEALCDQPAAVRGTLALTALKPLGVRALPLLARAAGDKNPMLAAFAAELHTRLGAEVADERYNRSRR
jgi:HEAT repeat protein